MKKEYSKKEIQSFLNTIIEVERRITGYENLTLAEILEDRDYKTNVKGHLIFIARDSGTIEDAEGYEQSVDSIIINGVLQNYGILHLDMSTYDIVKVDC